jgi:hypothetical protein
MPANPWCHIMELEQQDDWARFLNKYSVAHHALLNSLRVRPEKAASRALGPYHSAVPIVLWLYRRRAAPLRHCFGPRPGHIPLFGHVGVGPRPGHAVPLHHIGPCGRYPRPLCHRAVPIVPWLRRRRAAPLCHRVRPCMSQGPAQSARRSGRAVVSQAGTGARRPHGSMWCGGTAWPGRGPASSRTGEAR